MLVRGAQDCVFLSTDSRNFHLPSCHGESFLGVCAEEQKLLSAGVSLSHTCFSVSLALFPVLSPSLLSLSLSFLLLSPYIFYLSISVCLFLPLSLFQSFLSVSLCCGAEGQWDFTEEEHTVSVVNLPFYCPEVAKREKRHTTAFTLAVCTDNYTHTHASEDLNIHRCPCSAITTLHRTQVQ